MSAEGDAGVATYLAAGDRMGSLMNGAWKVCLVLIVLVLVAWVLGVLPSAFRLF